ncbi:thioredoxin-like domain-containing protein [Flavobacterium qiangtangense]|uniref:Thioredoxin-like domain-containing protein n=1 Tax=Flavobacterium qiangtangense TaxID=1442595 RepID=A0ABW1PNH6_9FLAO
MEKNVHLILFVRAIQVADVAMQENVVLSSRFNGGYKVLHFFNFYDIYAMIKLLIFSFALSFSNLIFAQDKTFELNGIVNDSTSNTKIFLNYKNEKNVTIIDSADIVDNKFTFRGSINTPTKAYISNNNKFNLNKYSSEQIYLEPKKMNICFNFFDFTTMKLEGSKTQDEYLDLRGKKRFITEKLDSIYNLKNERESALQSEGNSVLVKELIKELQNLEKLIDKYTSNEAELEFIFVEQNPGSFIAVDLLLFRIRRRESVKYYSIINQLYKGLDSDVKNSRNGQVLSKSLEDFKKSGIGSKAPIFTAVDLNNKKVSISDFKNKKYILIDFWASWCAPCRSEAPFLSGIYNKYRKKGLEIISISTDKNLELWKSAIIKDKIGSWKHISIKENENIGSRKISTIEDNYFVTAIPVKVLIDKDGLIVGRWRGGGKENQKELEKLLFEIFKI